MGDEEAELKEYEKQLADVVLKLQRSPRDADLLSIKQELSEIIELTRNVLAEQKKEEKEAPEQKLGAGGNPARVGISQAAKRYVNNEVTELSGWRVGDRCLTLFLEDGKKYPAIVSTLKPETKSVVVTFVKYLNQQDTPLVFLERVAAEEEAAPAKTEKDGGKRAVVIKATDAPEVIERKKRLLKKQKREEKQQEKDKTQTQKINSWQSFQTSSLSRPASAASAVVLAGKSKNLAGAPAPEAAKGVRKRWDKGEEHEQDN
jgi:survival-of-motor-neuron-related-splicing factor 30